MDIWGSNAEVVENKGEQGWIFGEAVQRWLKHGGAGLDIWGNSIEVVENKGEQSWIFGEAVPRWLKTRGSRVGYSGKQCRGG